MSPRDEKGSIWTVKGLKLVEPEDFVGTLVEVEREVDKMPEGLPVGIKYNILTLESVLQIVEGCTNPGTTSLVKTNTALQDEKKGSVAVAVGQIV